jgi:penicillin-binding protein 1C
MKAAAHKSGRGAAARAKYAELPPLLAAAVFVLVYVLFRFGPYRDLAAFLARPHSIRFYDRYENLVQIGSLGEGLRREFIPLDELPAAIPAVFLAAEDRRFYWHPGIDAGAALRAFSQNLRAGRTVSGASTITMQLARIVAGKTGGGRKRGLAAKAGEALNALRLESRFSKRRILELYLNTIPFGFQTEGVPSAARNFFSAEPAMLTPAEIGALAVIPRNPAAYNPFTKPEACAAAARALAERLGPDSALAGLLRADERELPRGRRFAYPRHMPHLVRHVTALIDSDLIDSRLSAGSGKYSAGQAQRSSPREYGQPAGGRPAAVVLSADLGLQLYAEDLLAAAVRRHAQSRLNGGAVIVVDNDSGEVLAWVGSADFSSGQIDGVLTPNQNGSVLKPFLYALALEEGFTPADVLADIPSSFGGEQVYIPQNFNNRYNGPVLFRTALASSLNIPAVRLLDQLGAGAYIGFLRAAGFALPRAEEAGLGLALGNEAVSLAELAAAFAVFPRDGVYLPLVFEKDRAAEARAIMKADTARLVCSILSDAAARRPGFGNSRTFRTPFPAMFKTGTANQFQNIAAVGATPSYTAAVWMGNFSGETVIGRTGSSVPAAIVRDLLVRLQGRRAEPFREPSEWSRTPVCALSGMAPGPFCPVVIDEYLPLGAVQSGCDWHRGGPLVYPGEYQAWFLDAGREGTLDYEAAPLEIVTPQNDFVYVGAMTGIPVEVNGGTEAELEAEYDGTVYRVRRPFRFSIPYLKGRRTLTVRCGGETRTVTFRCE